MIGWRKQPKRKGAGHADDIRREPKNQRLNSAGAAAFGQILHERERRDRRPKTTSAAEQYSRLRDRSSACVPAETQRLH